jgi:arsenate reductase (thioredoxin)
MSQERVLFVCIHNSARSQMAEALLNQLAGDRFQAESAGLEPGTLNPLVVEAMRRMNIDISGKKTQSVFDVYKNNPLFSYVITVCDEASGERCPIFPGICKRLHWSFEDPSSFTGTYEQKLSRTLTVRDAIKARVDQFVQDTLNSTPGN